jgi:hypothetical protein
LLIAVVVVAVATFIDCALAGSLFTNVSGRPAAAERAAHVQSGAARADAGPGIAGGMISTDLDGFRTAASGNACEHAKDNCPRSTLRHWID